MPAAPENNRKRPLCLGLLAHVDAGKTTLSEAMLFTAGRIRRLGRVDHGDAFLDTDAIERERGITIFSKQAVFSLPQTEVTLLDTPGHVDFSTEAERVLQVLDCAVLVISGTDGVQSHTRTLWRLLGRYGVPVLIFVNKTDLPGVDREARMRELRASFGEGCVDAVSPRFAEDASLTDENALAEFLETGTLGDAALRGLFAGRKLFPCYFGSALRLDGVEALLAGVERFAPQKRWQEAFGAKVFKIARDRVGARMTYLRVTGGTLRVKDVLSGRTASGEAWSEKADQLRLYSGEKYTLAEEVPAGGVCAVTGLSQTRPGEGIGAEPDTPEPVLESFLTYQVLPPPGLDAVTAAGQLRELAEEDPALRVVWNEELSELHVRLMGEVQLEVLRRRILDRFGVEVDFGPGSIVYRETLKTAAEGMGHFEPLRHYAEVHLWLEPGPPGSGVRLASEVSEDELDRNWQRLILTHLSEREFPGVLTGSPITDVKITLIAGRAHLKHTEGGDFREATYRAVRHGLLNAESVLLEPWYEFRLDIPSAFIGRAMTDLERFGAEVRPPETLPGGTVLSGSAPAAALSGYGAEVAVYTKGMGALALLPKGYFPCLHPEEVIRRIGYDPERDLQNTGDSVFCAHGSGFIVPWREAASHMHLEPRKTRIVQDAAASRPAVSPPPTRCTRSFFEDDELRAIFERTYGPIRRRDLRPQSAVRAEEQSGRPVRVPEKKPEAERFLLVDGYNIIHAWETLSAIAERDLDTARGMLTDLLSNYRAVSDETVILVFDAYRVPRPVEDVEQVGNITVVFTKQAETADTYIERASLEIGKRHRVRVATADYAEQVIVLGHGAERVSAAELENEVRAAVRSVRERLDELNARESAGFGNRPIVKDASEKPNR